MTGIIRAINNLEVYVTNKVQEWNEIRQKPDNSDAQYIAATAVWQAYRDMAGKLADLGELAERRASHK
jgi:hypothetical protein